MIIGGLTGILGTIVTVLYAATGAQADTLLHHNEEHGQKLDDLLGTTESMDQKLDKLDGIEAAIIGDEGVVHELDAVQLEPDMQTGVLDEQLTVLREIRESL